MSALVRLPHGLLRRYLSLVERVLVAAALSGLVYGLLKSVPIYPTNWDLVIVALIFVVAVPWPAAAYFVAVAAAAYPLYTLSLYIVVLFLAVALLGQRVFIHNLGATILVLAAPWLARYQVAWIVPLLGGLWWGAAGGAWIGALSALLGQVIAGMAGLNPDWLARMGTSPSLAGVAQRFNGTGSLETLERILEPVAPNTTVLLYHLLQVVIWAAVGGMLGALADRAWAQRRRPWSTIIFGVVGAFALLGLHVALALWLDQYTLADLTPVWLLFVASAVVVAVVAGALEGLRDFVEHPLPPARRLGRSILPTGRVGARQRVSARGRRAARAAEPTRAPLPVPSQLPDGERGDQEQDLIMLELD